jgi:pathogenesis-related protein 1
MAHACRFGFKSGTPRRELRRMAAAMIRCRHEGTVGQGSVKTSWSVRIVALPACLILLAASAWPEPESRTPEWADAMVQAHNSIRNRSKLPPLVWSDRVAAVAQQWAETLLARDEFAHRPKSEYGENLFEIRGANSSPAQVVSAWASESRNYDYRTNSCRDVCGHYTQIIWRDTKELGCGVARNARREIWVCDYNPPGNWVGRRPF